MANNFYLFTGENQYELRAELKRRKDNFAQKFGADTVFVYNSENRDAGSIRQSIFGGGLFVSKKLIIVQGIPQDNETTNKLKIDQTEKLTDEIMNNKAGIPDDTILICVSYNPDKRGRFYKFITKEGQTKEFKPLDKIGLKSFVKREAEGLELKEDTINTLIQKVGMDQFRLASEIEKLRFWKERNPEMVFTPALIEEISFGMVEADSFKFFDHLFTDSHKACQILQDMQEEGSDRNQVNGLLYRGLKNYLIVLDFHHQGITDSKTIVSEAKMNPYSVSNLLKQSKTLLEKEEYITTFFKRLIELDYDIKTGAMPAEYFRLRVKELVLS